MKIDETQVKEVQQFEIEDFFSNVAGLDQRRNSSLVKKNPSAYECLEDKEMVQEEILLS
jgi:hypothetical protein